MKTEIPGSADWLRAKADEYEKLLMALGAIDEECEREQRHGIEGLRSAAARLDLLEASVMRLERKAARGRQKPTR